MKSMPYAMPSTYLNEMLHSISKKAAKCPLHILFRTAFTNPQEYHYRKTF